MKQLSRYSPEERQKIVDRLIALGKDKGGLYSAEEYGKRMIVGQKKRLQKLAIQNGRKIRINDVNDRLQSGMIPSANIALLRKPNKSPQLIGLYRDRVRGIDTVNIPTSNQINPLHSIINGDVAAHEADEYSLLLRNSKRLNQPVSLTDELTHRYNKTNTGEHNIGVLNRERKRRKMLSSIYGNIFPERSQSEIDHNNVSLNTLLKFKDSLSKRELELRSAGTTKSDNLKQLLDQKSKIEEFIRRKQNIESMHDGIRKQIEISKLRQDLEYYNTHLDKNRKSLKFDF